MEAVSWARCHGPHRGAFREGIAAKQGQGQQPGLLTAGSGTADLVHVRAGFLYLIQTNGVLYLELKGHIRPQHLLDVGPSLVSHDAERSSFSLPLGVQELLRR